MPWGRPRRHDEVGGDPTRSRAVIYRLNWEAAWKDGVLDEAVRDVIEDDAAVNGCRPEFVTVGGRTLLATADYGDVRPESECTIPKRCWRPGDPVRQAL